MPLCSIIIPVYNKWELTSDCLRSLAQYTPMELIEVVLVDNGSSDETVSEAPVLGRTLFGERFTYVRRDTDTFFAAGCNHGAREAAGEFLFFLNNDTVLTENWLPPLLEPFRTMDNVGATGPVLLFGEDLWGTRVQHLGISYDPDVHPRHLYSHFPHDHPVVKKQREFQSLTGAALMIPKTLFREAGAFHEEYINGLEDVELTALLSVNGLRLLSVPESCFYHLEGQSEGRKNYEVRNSNLYRNRVQRHLHADTHRFFNEDGYTLKYGPLGRVECLLSEERKQELHARYVAEPEIEHCEALLKEEPVWIEGYELLVHRALKEKNVTTAVVYALLQTYFKFDFTTLDLLLAVSSLAGNNELVQKTAKMIVDEKEGNRIKAGMANTVYYRDLYRSSGMTELEQYLDDWLKEYGASYS